MVARRRTLLLADDSLTIQKVVSLTFSDEGVEVVTASDGAQALRLIEEGPPPDIILADTYMPGPDGYQICERVKRDPSLSHIPVVLLVGTFEPFNEAEARRVGADMVLTKPFQSIKGLVSKVGSLFGGGRAEEEEQEATRPLPPRDAPAPREARPWDEPRVTETDGGAFAPEGEPAVAASAAEIPFADLALDDPMIESRDVESPGIWDESGDRRAGWQEEAPGGTWDARAPSAHVEPAAHFDPEFDAEFAASGESAQAQHFDASQNFEAPPAERHAEPQGFDQPTPTPAHGFDEPAHAEARGFEEPSRAEMRGFDEPTPSSPRGFDEASYANAQQSAQAVGVVQATDDALLDLDDVAFPSDLSAAPAPASGSSVAVADDDFILDLDDGAPRTQAAAHAWGDFVAPEATRPSAFASDNSRAEAEPRADAAGSLAEAAHGERELAPELSGRVGEQTFYFDDTQDETPTVIAPAPQIIWEEQPEQHASADATGSAAHAHEAPAPLAEESMHTPTFDSPASFDSATETAVTYEDSGASAQPSALASAAEAARADETHAAGARRVGLEDLSPEVIDAIARRVVEHLSESVVREIAWEVVPQLSELLIKQRLDERK